ncbi:MAG: ribonuclease R [Streptococcaceae bacterium]|jgi:ribonuclease R|nr:ribonuclease R [Streptococcaceae bacterium]
MTIKETIQEYLKEQNKRLSMEELALGLKLNKSSDFKELVQTIAQMERDGQVQFNKKGKIYLPTDKVVVEGVFRANERGFGFVTIDPEEDDVFIAPDATGFALDGDMVELDIIRPANPFEKKGAEGKVVGIKERKLKQIVGVFTPYSDEEVEATQLYGIVKPKDKKLNNFTVYAAAQGLRPTQGALVLVELTHYPEKSFPTQLEGIIKKTIGYITDPGMDILEIIHSHGISPDFREDALKMAEEIPDKIASKDYEGRRDLRDQVIVTIDGEDAKDLDDAVTVRKLENGNYFLGVHIADVSHYVTENSPLDLDAYNRGTSVYLADRVIPMIPQRLSNGICSLNPHVPRLTMSCEMEIDLNGEIVKHDIFPSVIQTTERMTYTAVNQIIERSNVNTLERYESLIPLFDEMSQLHHILETMRNTRGAINFDENEAKILVDEDGNPTEIVKRERATAERLIESFMLAANETVAQHFSELHLPFIYRIHEHPKMEKLERFFDFAAVFGIVVQGTVEKVEQAQLNKVLEDLAGKPEEGVISTMMLRSMQQAKYSESNYGHFGLAAQYYTHFTSPIRRYPDLIVHRLIKSYAQSKNEARQEKWNAVLPDIAMHSSQMERRAVEAEREVDDMKKAEYMSQFVDQEFEGIISSVTKFGFFVELPNTVEGLVHVSTLKHDYFNFFEKYMALVGERTGEVLRLGQKVTVKLVKADKETREIDFEFVAAEEVAKIEYGSPKRARREVKSRNREEKRQREFSSHTKGKGNKNKKKKPVQEKEFGKNFQKKKGKSKPFYTKVAKKKKK